MLTQAVKSINVAKYLEKNNENVIRNLINVILDVDLWFFITAAHALRRSIRFLKPILEVICAMSIGAGLLLAYSIMHMPSNYFEQPPTQMPAEKVMAIDDASTSHDNFMEQEILHLRNKAMSLELSLKKMNMQVQALCRPGKEEKFLPDFASEAAGGSVIATPDTESFYNENEMQQSRCGIPVWKPNYFTPRKIIQPWTQAGECWAFRGAHGNVEIELARLALVDSVALEHIPVSASLTKSINSAPKEFRVLGKFRSKYLLLGAFTYNYNGPSTQIFQIDNADMKNVPIKIVMLQVFSNWGNPDYTCIYRFKVHGVAYNSENSLILNRE